MLLGCKQCVIYIYDHNFTLSITVLKTCCISGTCIQNNLLSCCSNHACRGIFFFFASSLISLEEPFTILASEDLAAPLITLASDDSAAPLTAFPSDLVQPELSISTDCCICNWLCSTLSAGPAWSTEDIVVVRFDWVPGLRLFLSGLFLDLSFDGLPDFC